LDVGIGAEALKLQRPFLDLITDRVSEEKPYGAEPTPTVGDAPFRAIEALSNRARDIRATTPEGAMAKARLLRFWLFKENAIEMEVDFDHCGMDIPPVWSLVEDMVAMGRV
jgi:hypothetical protein